MQSPGRRYPVGARQRPAFAVQLNRHRETVRNTASLAAILRRAGRGDTGHAKSRRDRTGDACRAYRACPHFARAPCMQGGALSVDRRARPPLRHGTAFRRTNGGGRPARRRHAFGHALGARTHHRRHRPCWRVLDLPHRLPGDGIAIPHARLAGLQRPFGLAIRLKEPCDFEAMDGEPVDLVVLLLVPPTMNSEHLAILSRVARTLRDPVIASQLRRAPDRTAILERLKGTVS